MLLETTRECLRDVFDVPALREVMTDLRSRKTKLVAVDTERASPFAQSLLFRWVAIYMYEGDAPLAERRAAALALDRDLLRELLGEEELRDLLDPAAFDELEIELQSLAEGRRARNADDVHDLLVSVGDLTESEIAARTEQDPSAWIERVLAEGRAMRVRVAGEARLVAVEDAAALRDALGVSLPIGLPGVFTEPDGASARRRSSPGTPARTRRSSRARRRPGWGPAWIACGQRSTRWRRADGSRTASSAPRTAAAASNANGATSTCFEGSVADRSPRSARRSSRSTHRRWDGSSPRGRDSFRRRPGPTLSMDAISRLQGAAVPASILEHDVLPARVRGFRPVDLDALCASGDLVWIGAGPLGADDGRVSLYSATRCASSRHLRRTSRRPVRSTSRSADTSHDMAHRSGPTWCRRPGPATNAWCSPRSGTWSGRARSRTTRWRPSAR